MPLVKQDEPASLTRNGSPKPWYLNAYLHIALNVFLTSVGQIIFKIGTDQVAYPSIIGVTSLASPWVWLGMIILVVGLFSWLHALRTVPIVIAFNLSAGTQVVVPLFSWMFLGEHVSWLRWGGIILVTCGILIVAGPLARMEEKL
jgi:drug/metabolite transporter (DMT)-like permease